MQTLLGHMLDMFTKLVTGCLRVLPSPVQICWLVMANIVGTIKVILLNGNLEVLNIVTFTLLVAKLTGS